MYQVIIAEDEFFVRLGIKNSVSWEKYNMQVVCDAGNGAEALRACLLYTSDAADDV